MTASQVDVRIVQRRSGDGHPFSEVLYAFTRDGVRMNACTRYWFVVSDTPHARANEVQGFLRRQNR